MASKRRVLLMLAERKLSFGGAPRFGYAGLTELRAFCERPIVGKECTLVLNRNKRVRRIYRECQSHRGAISVN
jgi:hypothetical protein